MSSEWKERKLWLRMVQIAIGAIGARIFKIVCTWNAWLTAKIVDLEEMSSR